MQEMISQPYELLKILGTEIAALIKCEQCGESIIINNDIIGRMIDDFFVKCPHCDGYHNICKYYVDIKFIPVNEEN